uniref:Uncharacterized protein n=1 Tax=Cacopsylla melanoneura TaxID=428564 RepID=A0A8D8W961_9HEMI
MECSMCLTVLTDSTTVASQIRKEGGIRSKILLLETDKLLRLVYSLQSVLKPPLTEDIQHTGRQALSEPSSPRVAPDGRGNFSYLQEMGNARSGLICLPQIGRGPKLCDTRPVRSSSPLHGCFFETLGVQPCLDLPPFSPWT